MRLEGLQGAVLGVKLRYLEQWIIQRRAWAARYREMLADSDLLLPAELPESRHAYHLYVIRSSSRDELQAHLNSSGVPTGIHYPTPVHLQAAHQDLGYRLGDFPVAESTAQTVLSLPLFPELTTEQQQQVLFAVEAFAPAEVMP
jgi:dTDP-4-amino-4,6-dideoxygalactose transaminase